MSIQILPAALRDQIAAGEVVERPASIVKELIENSLDAGATQITVTVKNGGKDLIQGEDNGTGMDKNDALLAVERYATSKIQTLDDLMQISSFGFRGEALASIASVADFTLQTKREADLSGTQVQLIYGEQKKVLPIGCKTGAKISVKNLFRNVPARLKFFKADATENGYILKTLQNFVILNPKVAFKYINNAKTVLDLLPEEDTISGIKIRLQKIFPPNLTAKLQPVDFDLGYLKISGFVSPQDFPQNNRNYQYVFVNRRSVEDRTIKAAATESYQGKIPRGAYPAYFIFVEIAPEMVDVNVHPRKTEVRFLRQQEVYQAVLRAIEKTFQTAPVTFSRSFVGQSPHSVASFPRSNYLSADDGRRMGNSHKSLNLQPKFNHSRPSANEIELALNFSRQVLNGVPPSVETEMPLEDELSANQSSRFRIIGQLAMSYLLVEKGEKFLIIDQHAADERIRYEKIRTQYQQKTILSQALLLPVKVDLTPLQKNFLDARLDFFEKLGFDLEFLGGRTYLLNAVPSEIKTLEPEQTFLDLLAALEDEFKNEIDLAHLLDLSFKYMACRSAIKFGDKLTFPAMQFLIETLFQHPEMQTCPHGRPVIWQMELSEIKKKFGR